MWGRTATQSDDSEQSAERYLRGIPGFLVQPVRRPLEELFARVRALEAAVRELQENGGSPDTEQREQ